MISSVYLYAYKYLHIPCGVIAMIIGNGHCDPSSNPGCGCLHFTWC